MNKFCKGVVVAETIAVPLLIGYAYNQHKWARRFMRQATKIADAYSEELKENLELMKRNDELMEENNELMEENLELKRKFQVKEQFERTDKYRVRLAI